MIARIVQHLARSRRIARRLLGLELPPLEPGERYFDSTTLALLRCLRRRVPEGVRLLDVGTGSSAALGLVAWREKRCRVVATELDPRIAARARACVARNGAPIEILTANLFEGVEGSFDLVVFNPPYVPTATGRARGLPRERSTEWDGGADGTETIAAFLDALPAEDRVERALLGVNRRHVPRAAVERLIAAQPGLDCEEVLTSPWLPGIVYVLVRRKSPRASTSSPEE